MNWTLFPSADYTRDVATLWWTMFGVAAAVWLAVVLSLLVAIRRRRAPAATETGAAPPTEAPYLGEESRQTRLAVMVATLATIGILFFFMGYDFVLGRETPQHVHRGGLTVTVQSRQWWWEFIYEDTVPEKRLSVANELHIPVGVPVNLVLKSPDVIHSVWAPRLAGKQDAVPGYTGSLVFTADTAGIYGGVCAEFCGVQHANMRFTVVAHTQQEFEEWYAIQRAPAVEPTDSTRAMGKMVFMSGSCATCHAIAGTAARASRGPALTHVGSRRDLAAGTLPNTDENMMRWIRDPQAIKPGTQMPASPLPADQLQALVAYLRSLK
jgi:cytochrome c oxidase subunit 2